MNYLDMVLFFCAFYNTDKIVTAKKILYDVAALIDMGNLPTNVDRKGVNKLSASVNDTLMPGLM